MATNSNGLGMGEKFFGVHDLVGDRSEVIKKTYLLLSLSVVAAFCGGYLGLSSEPVVQFFGSRIGWLVAMGLLFVMPRVAIAARHNPVLGVTALVADGFISGLVLTPILFYASQFAPGMIQIAAVMTLVVFATVTIYVMSSGRTFSAPKGLMTGIFVSIVAATVLNMFLNIGLLGIIIAAGIGILGVCILVYGTSEVIHNPEADSPIPGALILFAGLFNVFVSILNLLLRVGNGGRR